MNRRFITLVVSLASLLGCSPARAAADARAIHTAFRDAGLRAGRALNDAVKAAGFDPDRLVFLDQPAAGLERPRLFERIDQADQSRSR